jgi:hypothetical protein
MGSMRALAFSAAAWAWGCGGVTPVASSPEGGREGPPVIDRFSATAGHLMVRTPDNGLPGPGQPIDLDRPPFVTQGFAADGSRVRYYNFDIQPAKPATLYRLTHTGERAALPGQLDIIDGIPGDRDYSDFFRIAWAEVPPAYVVDSITSADQVRGRALHVEMTGNAIDCPVVPRGTTAREATGVDPAVATEVWYRGQRVTCLRFGTPLTIDAERVPTSPIYVTFAKPGAFRTEAGAAQTHNVVMSLPGDVDYSPLWAVHVYEPTAFDRVVDGQSAMAAKLVDASGPLVNCPVQAIVAR